MFICFHNLLFIHIQLNYICILICSIRSARGRRAGKVLRDVYATLKRVSNINNSDLVIHDGDDDDLDDNASSVVDVASKTSKTDVKAKTTGSSSSAQKRKSSSSSVASVDSKQKYAKLQENSKGWREYLSAHSDSIRLDLQRQQGDPDKAIRHHSVVKEAGLRWRRLSDDAKAAYGHGTPPSKTKVTDGDETER